MRTKGKGIKMGEGQQQKSNKSLRAGTTKGRSGPEGPLHTHKVFFFWLFGWFLEGFWKVAIYIPSYSHGRQAFSCFQGGDGLDESEGDKKRKARLACFDWLLYRHIIQQRWDCWYFKSLSLAFQRYFYFYFYFFAFALLFFL
jgi:hypothetical protein